METKVKLPEGYKLITEGKKAVLAVNERKEEYVAWTKEATGGVCWGRYFSYHAYAGNPVLLALQEATKAFMNKEWGIEING